MKLHNPNLQKAIGFALLAFLPVPAAWADVWDKKTSVTFREPVEFPGGTILAPGNYVLKLLNSASNRNIVQVYNQEQDRMFAMVMANPARRTEPADRTIITFYETPQGQPAFIRTWFYPGDTVGQEFPYPKNRAGYVTALALPAKAEERPQVKSYSEASQVPAEQPMLLTQSTSQQGIPQTPRAEVVSDATAPADLSATADNAPYFAAGSAVLLASAFLVRMARRVGV